MSTLVQKTFFGSIMLTVGFFGSVHMAQAEICSQSDADEAENIAETMEFAKVDYDDTLINNQAKIEENNTQIEAYKVSQEQFEAQLENYRNDLTLKEQAISQIEGELELLRGDEETVSDLRNQVENEIAILNAKWPRTPAEEQRLADLRVQFNDLFDELGVIRSTIASTEAALDTLKGVHPTVQDLTDQIAATESQLQTVTDAIVQEEADNLALQGEIDTARATYEDAMSDLQLLLGMSGDPTHDQLLAEKDRVLATWQDEDCDGDGTLNGQDDFPNDDTKDTIGQTGGIVPCGAVGSNEMCHLCDLIVGIHKIIKWGLGIMFVVAIVIITIAGIMYIVSAGNESMMQAAKKALMYALVGVAIMLLAWVIVTFVIGMLVGNTTGGVNTDNGVKYFSSYSCDGDESSPPTPASTLPEGQCERGSENCMCPGLDDSGPCYSI